MRLADLEPPEPIRAGGEVLAVRRLGAGPRLVLLHGGPGLDHHLLLPLALPLAGRFEVWLPDLPGHGATPGTPPGLRQIVSRLGRFLAEVGPAAIGGHSLGAWLVRKILREQLVQPRAAILLCPPGPLRGVHARRAARLRQAEDEAALRAALREEVAMGRPLPPLVEEAIAATVLRPPQAYARLLEELRPLLQSAVPPIDPRCPTLVLGGALDPVAPPALLEAVAAATRGATLTILPGTGHYPWAADPRPCVGAIEAFLALTDAAG